MWVSMEKTEDNEWKKPSQTDRSVESCKTNSVYLICTSRCLTLNNALLKQFELKTFGSYELLFFKMGNQVKRLIFSKCFSHNKY